MHSTDGIRSAVTAMDREVTLLSPGLREGDGTHLDSLRTSWRALVDALALGPAPEYRKCPQCGATGMRAATRCGTCWTKLVPPPANPSEVAPT